MKSIRQFPFLLFILLVPSLNAETAVIDSLENRLRHPMRKDTARVDLLNATAGALYQNDNEHLAQSRAGSVDPSTLLETAIFREALPAVLPLGFSVSGSQISMPNLSILKQGKAKAIRLSTLKAICKALGPSAGRAAGIRGIGNQSLFTGASSHSSSLS